MADVARFVVICGEETQLCEAAWRAHGRYQPAEGSTFAGRGMSAVLDTLICAQADAFLGSRRSMFSFNILEERILQGLHITGGRYM